MTWNAFPLKSELYGLRHILAPNIEWASRRSNIPSLRDECRSQACASLNRRVERAPQTAKAFVMMPGRGMTSVLTAAVETNDLLRES
jgi:hypothetical protein